MSQEYITRQEFDARHTDLQRVVEMQSASVEVLRQSVDKLSESIAEERGQLKLAKYLIPTLTGVIGALFTAFIAVAFHL